MIYKKNRQKYNYPQLVAILNKNQFFYFYDLKHVIIIDI